MSAPQATAMRSPHQNRSWGFKNRGLLGGLILAPAGIYVMMTPAPVLPEWAAFGFNTLGWMVFVAGAIMRFWSTLYLGGRKAKTVVCQGPYSVARNPLYLGSMLLAFSAGIFLHSIVFTAATGLAMFSYSFFTVPGEEAYLREMLGAPYDTYCARVPRFWPRWSLLETDPQIEVSVPALRLELKRALVWFWIPVYIALIQMLRSSAAWQSLLP